MKTYVSIPRSLRTALLGGCMILVLAALTQGSHAAVTTTTIELNTAANVAAAFPSKLLQGSASVFDFDTTSQRLHVRAQTATGDSGSANANVYSAATYSSALNFFQNDSVTITFSNVSMTMYSTGSYYEFNFGICNENSGNMVLASGPPKKIYFEITRDGNKVNLVSGTNAVLGTWSFGSGVYNNLASASLTLTATGWEATVISKVASDKSGTKSGTFATPLKESDWSDFYIGMHALPGTSGTDRYVNGYVGSITIASGVNAPIPEPTTVAAILGGNILALAAGLRWRFRK